MQEGWSKTMSNAVLFQIKYVAKNPPKNLPIDKAAEYVNKRKFYDWTAKFNYVEYTLNDKKVERNKDFNSYASRQGNLGMFNAEKVYTEEEIKEIKEQLKNTQSHIWHGFISFDEKINNKFQTQEQAMHFMKQHFNDFIKRTHLNVDNICLLASLHKDTENRHIHFSFFEKEPQHIDKHGNVCFTSKGNFKQSVIDNWLVSANMAVAEKDDYYSSRNALLLKLREMKASSGAEFTDKELQLRLLNLGRNLPRRGRLSYNSENIAKLRPEIDKLAKFILCSNPEVKKLHQDFLRQLDIREKKVQEIKKGNKIKSKVDYMNNLHNDYKSRIGNLVISLAREMSRQYAAAYYRQTDKQKKLASRRIREHGARVYNNFTSKLLYALSQVQKDMEAEFTHSVKDAELLILQEMEQGEAL